VCRKRKKRRRSNTATNRRPSSVNVRNRPISGNTGDGNCAANSTPRVSYEEVSFDNIHMYDPSRSEPPATSQTVNVQ